MPGIFGGDVDGAFVEFVAGGGVESVEALMIVAGRILRHGDGVDDAVRPGGRLMTGVEVIPISGVTWEQPRSSEVVSPDLRVEMCQMSAPVSASKA